MFSPGTWFTAAVNFQTANMWFNWTIFILSLLVTGWLVHKIDRYRIQWGAVIVGIIWSVIVTFAWPLVIAIIPILFYITVMVGVVLLPKQILVWIDARKLKKAALKAISQSVDKS